ncbi:unnamed protein product [Cuscuta campestris]|uniref:Retrotransposon Copia-like N-terminal domain-containing protein n=1 Tax=Cuscuta campestris TaxID=132261 RepID=A0A484LY86_9ASTE|nr:unnamed protein product [Cuscuta campestris]
MSSSAFQFLSVAMFAEVAATTKKTRLIHDPSSIYYLHPSEGPDNSLTKYLLKSDTFDIWEKAILNALGGRGKSVFLSSVGVPKPTDEHELSAWRNVTGLLFVLVTIAPTQWPLLHGMIVVRRLPANFCAHIMVGLVTRSKLVMNLLVFLLTITKVPVVVVLRAVTVGVVEAVGEVQPVAMVGAGPAILQPLVQAVASQQ